MFGQILVGIAMICFAVHTFIKKEQYIVDEKKFYDVSADAKRQFINAMCLYELYAGVLFIVMGLLESKGEIYKIFGNTVIYIVVYIVLSLWPLPIVIHYKRK